MRWADTDGGIDTMRWLLQILEITRMGLSTVPQRLGSSLVIVVGIAGVVGVLVALLAMGEGFRSVLAQAGRVDEAIVLRKGASAELNSGLSRDNAVLIAQGPGILKNAESKPLASAEVVVVVSLPKKTTGTDANVEVRGVGPRVWELRTNAKIVDGRRFELGKRELVVGKGAHSEFAGLETGQTLRLGLQEWTVVGRFTTGDAHESELWGDAEIVQGAYSRDGYQSVTLKLTNADAFDTLKAALSTDPRLTVDVERTRDYYATQSEDLTRLIRILGVAIAAIMGVGAVFGALNTMYTSVSTRSREIATLRAIGFAATPVVIAVMLESAVLALLGGAIGAALSWLMFDKYTVSTLGANFSQVVFAFKVSPTLVAHGLLWSLVIGLLGGLLPAVAAGRMPVTVALRENV
jgi:putative ABC transport system permease protein